MRGGVVFSDWGSTTVRSLTQALSGADWQAVMGAQFLASEQVAQDLLKAHRLAPREMEQDHQRVRQVSRGHLRGKPDMRRTIRLRHRRQDETLWVVDRSVKRWQTEDNAAIAGFLAHLLSVSSDSGAPRASGWRLRVARTNELIERLLRAEPLRHVSPSPHWTGHEVPPTLISRSPFYRILWSYARAWREGLWNRDAKSLKQRLGGWLLAEDDDRLFELFVLSRLVEVVHGFGPWQEFSIRPSVVNSDVMIIARQAETTISVRYDRAPQAEGAYRWLFGRYEGLNAAMRRPDIQISVNRGGEARRTCLVEVKATNPASRYGRDSVYKVLGYLKDYDTLWEEEHETRYPRAVVVFATGVTPTVSLEDRVANDEVLVSSDSLIGDDLVAVIDRMMNVAS